MLETDSSSNILSFLSLSLSVHTTDGGYIGFSHFPLDTHAHAHAHVHAQAHAHANAYTRQHLFTIWTKRKKKYVDLFSFFPSSVDIFTRMLTTVRACYC